MPIKVTCEKCGGVLHAPDDAGGKKGRCPNCQNILPIPFEAPRAAGFGAPSGFSGASSPNNPPPGMAFSNPNNPIAPPVFPNADSKRPTVPPPFGVGARSDAPGLASSTPGMIPPHTAPGMGSSLSRQSVPFGARPAPSSSMPIAPESVGWRSAASGLRWCQIALVLFLIAVVAPCGVTVYATNGGQSLAEKAGMLKWEGVSLLVELRLATFAIPAILGGLCLVLGRFKLGSVPASSMARGPAKLGAYFTVLSFCGLIAVLTVAVLGMHGGFIPTLEPTSEVSRADTPMSKRVIEYLNGVMMTDKDNSGKAQKLGLLAFLAFGKFAELFFGCSLGRIAACARNRMAAGRVTRCYLYVTVLALLAIFGLLGVELFGEESAKQIWGPKWFGMPGATRMAICCGVIGAITLLLTIAYWRMLGGVRKACQEMGA